jgi:SAM-dependent methyltransferase
MWEVERGLAQELLASSSSDREAVTRDVYNRLFSLVPWHDANTQDPDAELAFEDEWFEMYGPLTRPDDVLVDVGCGRGGLIRRFSVAVRECIGIDASDEMVSLASAEKPANSRFVVGSLISPPLPEASVDFVVSRQVMEHLHPDDVPGHLSSVRRLLRPGGRFLIETPSRLTGPWDVSRGFTETATGFHLKEYTNAELATMLKTAGFSRVWSPAVPSRVLVRLGRARRYAYVPAAVKAVAEGVLRRLPARVRDKASRVLVVREVTLVAVR